MISRMNRPVGEILISRAKAGFSNTVHECFDAQMGVKR